MIDTPIGTSCFAFSAVNSGVSGYTEASLRILGMLGLNRIIDLCQALLPDTSDLHSLEESHRYWGSGRITGDQLTL